MFPDDVNYPDIDVTPKFSRETKPALKPNVMSNDRSREKPLDENKNEESFASLYTPSVKDQMIPSTQTTGAAKPKEPSISSINSYIPSVDRSSKVQGTFPMFFFSFLMGVE